MQNPLLPLPTPEQMAKWDEMTIKEFGIPGFTLMENASREAVAVLLEEYGPLEGEIVHCFAGSGNNGGDAFAMARHMSELGADVTVFHTKPKKSYRGETATNLTLAKKLGIPLHYLSTCDLNDFEQPDIIIDGLLGTGFNGMLRNDVLELVENINQAGQEAFVMAIDIPSGLSGLTGQPGPEAVRADITVTFQAAKLGLAMPEAAEWTGEVHVVDIGIPAFVRIGHPVKNFMVGQSIMHTLPPVTPDMHKGIAGHVLIVGGSDGLTGAPNLAAQGALRAGAGLATIACPSPLAPEVKCGMPDIMTLPLSGGPSWCAAHADHLCENLDRFDAVVLGPGLGRALKTVDFLREFVARCPLPMVVDADGLYWLAEERELIEALPSQCIITPHPGEAARLAGVTNAHVQSERLETAELLSQMTNAVTVLKGAGTVIASDERTCIVPLHEPNLAVAGSGDVLSGMLGSLLAKGMDASWAANLAVYWHGMCGSALQEKFPARGNTASDIATMIPTIIKEFASC